MMTVNEAQNIHFLRFALMSIVLYAVVQAKVDNRTLVITLLFAIDAHSIVRSLGLASSQYSQEGSVRELNSKETAKVMWLVGMPWLFTMLPPFVHLDTKNSSLTFISFLIPLGLYVLALRKIESMISEPAAKIEEGGE